MLPKKQPYKKKCPVCDKWFKTKYRHQIFDTDACKLKAYRHRTAELLEKARAVGQ